MSARASRVRYFLYRPETMTCRYKTLRRIDWEADPNLSALVWLSVRLLGGSTKPTRVLALPLLEPSGGSTACRRAFVLWANGPTAILSPVRLPAFRQFLAWSVVLSPSCAEPEPHFPAHVARQAREVASALTIATSYSQ